MTLRVCCQRPFLRTDRDVIAFAVDTVGTELRELDEHFPDHKDFFGPRVAASSRRRARQALKEAVLSLRPRGAREFGKRLRRGVDRIRFIR